MDDGLRDRARGALMGLAVGDALGTTLEFSRRDRLPLHTEMTGGGPFQLAAGIWTDDTSMALALADSLINYPEFDAFDLMSRFVRWWQQGSYSATGTCFDIGITTRQALERFMATGNAVAGDIREDAAGNGSVMRLAPAVLHGFGDQALCRKLAADQSRTTHGAPQAVEGSMFFAEKLRCAILGKPKDEIVAPTSWDGHAAIRSLAAGGWRSRRREDIRASGYVVHTLEAAFWAVDETSSFEEALVLAVNLGEDADTVGAVTGQLAGALYGYAAIPARWLAPLAWHERIVGIADRLIRSSSSD